MRRIAALLPEQYRGVYANQTAAAEAEQAGTPVDATPA
jgi:hypothetical protein